MSKKTNQAVWQIKPRACNMYNSR